MPIIPHFFRRWFRMSETEKIAILGGTGDLGTGLAIRWAKAGHEIIIGSRTLAKAQKAVQTCTKSVLTPRHRRWKTPTRQLQERSLC